MAERLIMRARPPHVYAYELPARTILHPFFSIACPAPLTPTATQKGLGGCVWRASSSLFPLFTCSSLCHFSNRFDSRKVALFWLIANCCRTENAMKWIGVYIGISCFHFRSKRMDNGNFLPRTYIGYNFVSKSITLKWKVFSASSVVSRIFTFQI